MFTQGVNVSLASQATALKKRVVTGTKTGFRKQKITGRKLFPIVYRPASADLFLNAYTYVLKSSSLLCPERFHLPLSFFSFF